MASADWANREGTAFRYKKTISASESAAHPDYPAMFSIWGQNQTDEASRFADMVEYLKANGIVEDYSQIALLLHSVRQRHSGRCVETLERRGIPTFCPRSHTYFDTESCAT